MARLLLVVVFLFGCACAPPNSSSTPSPTTVGLAKFKLGVGSGPAPALPNSVLWLAKDLGFYQRAGLDVEIQTLQGTPVVVAGLLSGEFDLGNVATDELLRADAIQGTGLRAIHSPDPRLYFMIVGKSSIASIQDLPGKIYGVAQSGSVDDSLSRTVLSTLGVTPSSIGFITVGDPAARAKTLLGGQIDATAISIGSWVTIRNQPDVKVLVNVDQFYNAAPVVAKLDVATNSTIQNKPDQLRRFTSAIVEAERAFADDENMWVNAMAAARPDIEQEQLHQLWQTFRTSWSVNGALNLTEAQATADYYYASDSLKDVTPIDMKQWVDTEFIDAVLKEKGVDKRMDDPGRPIN
jgi:NitT/TauT family transport system substrate-binding protein